MATEADVDELEAKLARINAEYASFADPTNNYDDDVTFIATRESRRRTLPSNRTNNPGQQNIRARKAASADRFQQEATAARQASLNASRNERESEIQREMQQRTAEAAAAAELAERQAARDQAKAETNAAADFERRQQENAALLAANKKREEERRRKEEEEETAAKEKRKAEEEAQKAKAMQENKRIIENIHNALTAVPVQLQTTTPHPEAVAHIQRRAATDAIGNYERVANQPSATPVQLHASIEKAMVAASMFIAAAVNKLSMIGGTIMDEAVNHQRAAVGTPLALHWGNLRTNAKVISLLRGSDFGVTPREPNRYGWTDMRPSMATRMRGAFAKIEPLVRRKEELEFLAHQHRRRQSQHQRDPPRPDPSQPSQPAGAHAFDRFRGLRNVPRGFPALDPAVEKMILKEEERSGNKDLMEYLRAAASQPFPGNGYNAAIPKEGFVAKLRAAHPDKHSGELTTEEQKDEQRAMFQYLNNVKEYTLGRLHGGAKRTRAKARRRRKRTRRKRRK